MSSATTLRYLLIMRHAMAESTQGMMRDMDRPLTRQGVAEAENIGERLAAIEECRPFTVFCSEAVRARQTLECVSRAGIHIESVHYRSLFYQGSAADVLESLWSVDKRVRSLLVVGHNPSWSQMITHLTGAMVSLSPAQAVLLRRAANSWQLGLAMPGWDIVGEFTPS